MIIKKRTSSFIFILLSTIYQVQVTIAEHWKEADVEGEDTEALDVKASKDMDGKTLERKG